MELTENWFNHYYQDLIAFMQTEKQPFNKWGEVLEQQLQSLDFLLQLLLAP